MPATSTIPLDDLPGEHADDALFTFSVHGLGGSKIAANSGGGGGGLSAGIMASEVAPQQQ
ncbi:unnamed protein product, partial [Ectocarpus fasciculatus]